MKISKKNRKFIMSLAHAKGIRTAAQFATFLRHYSTLIGVGR